jgi:hypothetical protein
VASAKSEVQESNDWQNGSCDWNCAFINHFDLAQLHDRLQASSLGFNADAGV